MPEKIDPQMRDAFRIPMELPAPAPQLRDHITPEALESQIREDIARDVEEKVAERNGWMTTASGMRFHPLDPRPEEVVPYDLAHGLSHVCRFAGQCTRFYSVAQHSVLVSLEVGRRAGEPGDWDGQGISWRVLALYALLHDGSEAYTSDIPKPVKKGIPGFKAIEDRLTAAIHEHFNLRPNNPEVEAEIKRADIRLLATEARDLTVLEVSTDPWLAEVEPLPETIIPLGPDEARAMFTGRLHFLLRADVALKSDG
jgi:hypothetical protein